MIEVEVKLPLIGHTSEHVLKRLEELGFRKTEKLRETDIYFDNDVHQIRRQGEALRVRHVEVYENDQIVRSDSLITFKGKKMDDRSMTRQELETGVSDGEEAVRLFKALGFEPVEPKVVKFRQELRLVDMTACLDLVDGLGLYLELEIICSEVLPYETALTEIEHVLEQLGYRMEDTVRTSYLSMLMMNKI